MIVNLTPHTLNIHTLRGDVLDIPPSGDIARVTVTRELVAVDGDIEIFRTTYGQIEGLPAPSNNIKYVVSGLVLAALRSTRGDVFAPGELIRNNEGQPIGCKGLAQ